MSNDVANQQHYTAHKIEPIKYIVANNLNFLEGNIIKYVTRYKLKNGAEDLRKAKQYLDWLIEQTELKEKEEKEENTEHNKIREGYAHNKIQTC